MKVSIYEEAVYAYYGDKVVLSRKNASKESVHSIQKESGVKDSYTFSEPTNYGTYSCKGRSEKLGEIESEGNMLPKSYERLKNNASYYYKGRVMNDYELVKKAVESGKLELTEDMGATMALNKAFKVLVEDEARPKYGWGTTKYSADGNYTFTQNPDGSYDMHLVDKELGVSLDKIANTLASGMPNRNIDTALLQYFRRMDPERYEVAQKIGREMRTYNLLEVAYKAGALTERDQQKNLNFFANIFDKPGDKNFLSFLNKVRSTGDYSKLFEGYNPVKMEVVDRMRANS